MPSDDGLRLNDHEPATPSGPNSREPGLEDAIRGSKGNSLSSAPAVEDEPLVTKRKHPGLKGSPAPEERRERGEEGQKGRRHRGISLTHCARKFNDYTDDGILGRDRHTVSPPRLSC